MRKLLILVLLLPSFAYAAEGPFDSLISVITGFPDFVEKMFAYLIEWAVYIKFVLYMHSLEFAYGVAQHLVANLGLMDAVNAAMSSLSPDQRAIFETYGAREGLVIIINGLMTRFVLNFMGA
ncbi:DUF2523 domain-containing protein [Photobacterium sagamiensis]|uniref:DUF2523 family protein n=1 Tax=Photobacterium sagamiensis TaxID=2910241 RepID=UPI003D131959